MKRTRSKQSLNDSTAIGGQFIFPEISKSSKRNSLTMTNSFDEKSKKRRLDSLIAAMFSAPTSSRSSIAEADPTGTLPSISSNPPTSPEMFAEDTAPPSPPRRRTIPDQAAIDLSASWKNLIPTLMDDILFYYEFTLGKPVTAVYNRIDDVCPNSRCIKHNSANILALYFGHFCTIEVVYCACRSLPQALVKAGLFPTAPSHTRTAVSIDFLNFYAALFERSCDAVTATAAAINDFYSRRGFHIKNAKGEKMREPFRRGLGYAAQWLEVLHTELQERVDLAVKDADAYLRPSAHESNGEPSSSTTPPVIVEPEKTLTECTRLLRQLCPACFGGVDFGKSFADGCDVHVSTDGCFHHRHLVSAGQGMPLHALTQVLPKEYVDAIGDRLQTARKSPPRPRRPKVPDAALDECQSSYEAAQGDKKRGASGGKRYDAYGWMALTCRHDVPLMLANIDTPGEQQKYPVALIMWLFSQLPSNATVTALYDVGCVLCRSTELYPIFPDDIALRIQFATSAMHAYRHQWACQLAYNPRFMKGLGLSDGEGVERTWSKLRMLIPLIRTSSLAKRDSLTARQLKYIAYEVLTSLGDWVMKRHKTLTEERKKAQTILDRCGIPMSDLRQYWALQKEEQMSLRAHAPTSRKKELDTVISLQTDIEKVEKAIHCAKTLSFGPQVTHDILSKLSASHAELVKNAESLYTSLNIQTAFPDIGGVDHAFVQLLMLARDLKINIRKRATASFLEWARLDQAVAGRNEALGTKLHQAVHDALKKRQPALINSIRRFNQYCIQLEALYQPDYRIPLPTVITTKLAQLREDPGLSQDVWVTTPSAEPPKWLDLDVQNAILAMLKCDRCCEEAGRLDSEVYNMCTRYGNELSAVQVALSDPKHVSLRLQLSLYQERLLDLKDRWSRALGDTYQFNSRIQAATKVAGYCSDSTGNQPSASELAFPATELAALEDQEGLTCEGPLDLPDDLEPDQDYLCRLLSAVDVQEHEEDTSNFSYQEGFIEFSMLNDSSKLRTAQTYLLEPPRVPYAIQLRTAFRDQDIVRLASNSALLNATCVDNLASLLQTCYNGDNSRRHMSQKCAIFSVSDIVRTRYRTSDQELWIALQPSEYWTKTTWVVPIHRVRDGHWALAVVDLLAFHIHLYDSRKGDSQSRWKDDLEDISIFIRRAVALASTRCAKKLKVSTTWSASPAVKDTHNDTSGRWVMACIASTLLGYQGAVDTDQNLMLWWTKLASLARSVASSHT